MKITVVGCGYVGLVTGVGLASKGHRVTAVDISEARVGAIQEGRLPFYEPGLDVALADVSKAGNFRVAMNTESLADADVVMICVGTPAGRDGAIDLSSLRAATRQISQVLRHGRRYQVIAVRSTVIPGTTESAVWPALQEAARARRHPVGLAVNPEFLREGKAWEDFLNPDRIVIGEQDATSGSLLSLVYEAFAAPVIRTSLAAAEMIKYTSNALLATLISFSNEIARICETFPEVDAEEVLASVRLDRRLTSVVDGRWVSAGINEYLRAGCGYGGSCLPKDLRALLTLARERGLEPELLKAVQAVNVSQRAHFVDLAERCVGELDRKRALILGLSFKEGTDDVRDSPAISLAKRLLRRCASVVVSDPLVKREQIGELLELGVEFADDPVAAFKDADICFVTTSALEFKFVQSLLSTGRSGAKAPVVVDGRRIVSRRALPDPHNYVAVGLGVPPRRDPGQGNSEHP